MFDGPSLGGFVCPCTITSTELWKMGQVSPNDSVLFKPVTLGKPGCPVKTSHTRLCLSSLADCADNAMASNCPETMHCRANCPERSQQAGMQAAEASHDKLSAACRGGL